MKWKLLAPAALTGIFTLSTCKKDNSAPGNHAASLPKAMTKEVVSVWLGTQKDSSLLSYDGENRLTSIVSVTTPGFKITYQYNSDNTVEMNELSGQAEIYNKIWIGANHYADSVYRYNNETDTTGTKYTYNASNQLIQQQNYVYSHLVNPYPYPGNRYLYSYDNNGNATREDNDLATTLYEYYTNLVNPFSLTSLETFVPMMKNLVKTETTASGGSTLVITHTYQFDDKNRLIEDAAVGDDGRSDIWRYYY
ncbi:MAG TPA: hypothetical protein VG890_16115 [Puia sp.]|nr:hypothetical protein [Puia sp.]